MELNNDQIEKMIGKVIPKSTVCITVYDLDQKNVLFTTPGSYATFGVPKNLKYSELVKYFLDNIIHPDYKKEQVEIYKSGKFPPSREYRIIHPVNGERHIRVETSRPIKMENNNIIICVLMDIT